MNPWMWLLFVLAAAVVAAIVVGLGVSVVQQVRKGARRDYPIGTHRHWTRPDGRDPSYR